MTTRPAKPAAATPTATAAALAAALLGSLGGCTGATIGSGVGDAHLEGAPYYAGRSAPAGAVVAYAPVVYQAGATHAAGFDPGEESTAVAALLASMNARLDALAADAGFIRTTTPGGTPPDVQFGCDLDATGDCAPPADEGGVEGPGRMRMRLAVGRPSGVWTEAAASSIAEAGASALLLITLEVGHYWPRQTNWRGSKAVELGTERTVALPWLTSLETPVSVLQLTGALVGPDGRAIRIGAEGLRARRTPILASGFGAQALITDEDVEALLSERQDDRPGRPLVWEEALTTLVERLTGAPAMR